MFSDEQRQFAERFARFQNRIYAFVVSMQPGPEADEIFQETVVVLWEKWTTYDPSRDFTRWACGVARNVALRHWEKRQRQFVPLSDRALELVQEEFGDTQQLHAARLQAMDECLAEMPAKQRTLLEHRYGRRETVKQVATRTQQTANAIYQQLARLRRALQKCIDRKVSAEDVL